MEFTACDKIKRGHTGAPNFFTMGFYKGIIGHFPIFAL